MDTNERGQLRTASVGHAVFALTVVAMGIQGLVERKFNVLWQPVPKWLPAREVLVYVCAVVALLAGIGLVWRRTSGLASRVLLGWTLLWLLLVRLPNLAMAPGIDSVWAACKTAVMAAAAWVLYVWFADGAGLRIAQALYGLAMIPFGVAHFLYLDATAPLVPNWLPWHVAWAYITGATFIAAGIAIIIGVAARLVATLSTLQMGLFTLIVWLPVIAAGHAKPFQWSEFVVSWILTACGWVVAGSYRRDVVPSSPTTTPS
jgi:uncharacterized membrane protein